MIKKLFCLLLSVLLGVVLCSCNKVSYDMSDYESEVKSNDLLPSLSQLGSYTSVGSMHYHDSGFIYSADAYTLTVGYEKDDYESAKKGFLSGCKFQSSEIKDENGTKPYEFEYDGYTFKLFDFDYYSMSYPKEIYMMGYSDDNYELCFVYFKDGGLDSISGGFDDFLVDHCGWK